ncbi:unnamed protein product, partial [marine sediment metagenome]
ETFSSIPDYVDKIYAVNDCSTDKTYHIIQDIAEKDSRIVLINREVNGGVGAAIVDGFTKSLEDKIDISVVMAGDNQMDPAYLPDLLDPIVEERADFTKGNRLKKGYWKGMSKWRLFGNFLLTFLTKFASGYWHISDPQNGYVAVSSSALKNLMTFQLCEGYQFENDMMVKANVLNLRMASVLIPARYGNEKSKIRYGRFIMYTSPFLLKSFLWRLWKKYFQKGNSRLKVGILLDTDRSTKFDA